MGINDYGDTGDGLNNPPLGGPGGWAESVAQEVAGKVAKTGDTMTGNLSVQRDGNYGPRLSLLDTTQEGVSFTLVDGVTGLYRNAAGSGITTTKQQLQVGDPLVAADAANKGYVDDKASGGTWAGPAETDVIVATVDHGLGTADIGVSVTGLASGAGAEAKYLYVLYDVTSTYFRVQAFITATGGRITAGTQASFSWTAVKA